MSWFNTCTHKSLQEKRTSSCKLVNSCKKGNPERSLTISFTKLNPNVWLWLWLQYFSLQVSRLSKVCPNKLTYLYRHRTTVNEAKHCGPFFLTVRFVSVLLRISVASNISNIHQWMIHSVEYLSDRRSLSQKIFNLHSGLAIMPAQEQKQHEGVDDKPSSPAAVP